MRSESSSGSILLVDLGASFGGAEIYLENLLRPLRNECRCYVLCSHPEFQKRLSALNVKYFSLPCATGPLKVVQLVAACFLVPYLMIRHRIEVMQINGYAEIILIPVARLSGRTAVATRHLSFEIEVDNWRKAPGRFLARALYKGLARFGNRIICVSQQVADQVRTIVPEYKVTAIPNWVNRIPPSKPGRMPLSPPVRILFAGRMVEYKGLQILLQAMHQLSSDSTLPPLQLVAVGDGEYRTELQRQAEGLDVQFAGFQRDVTPFYEKADIFVSPSLGPEGSSLVGIEAMAQSVACVLSDLPVHREIACDGQAAMLFRRGDASDLAGVLRRLILDDSLRQEYGRSAWKAVRLNHNPETAIERYLEAFGMQNRRTPV